LKYNDMTSRDKVKAGEFYFTSRKRARAEEAYHKVVTGETLWEVSQQYGVKLKKLQRFNRMSENESLKPGTTLYLSSKRPKNSENVPVVQGEVLLVDKKETFDWEAQPASGNVESSTAIIGESVVSVSAGELQREDTVTMEEEDSTIVVESTIKADSATVESTEIKTSLYGQHVVKPGETLYAIAKKYDVGVMDLAEWNDLKIQDGIQAGQVLKLNDGSVMASSAPVKEKEIVHVVKSSETLYSVARKYGVTIQELKDWNGKTDSGLHVGERLKIVTIQ
jgi:membrane-bound lytic murein transglycosylase D